MLQFERGRLLGVQIFGLACHARFDSHTRKRSRALAHCTPTMLVGSGRRGGRRSGITGEPARRRTAAELSAAGAKPLGAVVNAATRKTTSLPNRKAGLRCPLTGVEVPALRMTANEWQHQVTSVGRELPILCAMLARSRYHETLLQFPRPGQLCNCLVQCGERHMSGFAGNLEHQAIRKAKGRLGAELRQRGSHHIGVLNHQAFVDQ